MAEEREPIEAELVEPPPRARPRARPAAAGERPAAGPPPAPLHIQIFAWPRELRARAIITDNGKRREVRVDGSLLAILLNFLAGLR